MTDECLTVTELAARPKLEAKTVRNRMYDDTWRRGVHWFSRRGLSPRFRWSRVVQWLEEDEVNQNVGLAYGPEIPRAGRGRRKRVERAVGPDL